MPKVATQFEVDSPFVEERQPDHVRLICGRLRLHGGIRLD
jgi:hypothetical protein